MPCSHFSRLRYPQSRATFHHQAFAFSYLSMLGCSCPWFGSLSLQPVTSIKRAGAYGRLSASFQS